MQPSFSMNSKDNISVEEFLQRSRDIAEPEGKEKYGERDSVYVKLMKCKTKLHLSLVSGHCLFIGMWYIIPNYYGILSQFNEVDKIQVIVLNDQYPHI